MGKCIKVTRVVVPPYIQEQISQNLLIGKSAAARERTQREAESYWAFVRRTAREVAKWPEWKRGKP